MLIQKIFHVRNSLEESKNRLGKISLYRRQLDGVEKAVIGPEGRCQFDVDAGLGVRLSLQLKQLPSDDANLKVFRSTSGDLDVVGSLEFFPIKGDLTEVVLTLDYRCKSLFTQMLDQCTGVFDSYLNRQLRCVESCLDSSGTMPAPQWQTYPQPVQYA